MKRVQFKVWNADRAVQVGGLFSKWRAAVAAANLAEVNSGEHYVVMPA